MGVISGVTAIAAARRLRSHEGDVGGLQVGLHDEVASETRRPTRAKLNPNARCSNMRHGCIFILDYL